ncbi:sigma-70 family RNA polymerase sigma factor [Luteolibacter yonseiensis]|uniref:Sigma-70 family RNA polymerase sigma factor n=1 Tax=Luteolibacter yonseiensis TaxID=1144680 RepID=A0A934R1N7_9BACT|nr:sigma-70 family RNA polymerase sigma factor [Luteolibacter yonseiensis]MBK1814498.1 sigma-70 family RNA polymerase sigma factor [Luteolibacter yonseiensis]
MKARTDSQLLHDYSERRSEAAFAELVRRHIDLVHSVARRLVNDPHRAQDVSQGVFVALSKDAARLMDHPTLSGWLHRTTRNIASQTVRTEVRRSNREHQAATMNTSSESEASWEAISPYLDAALDELNASDRDAVLLRYFENKPAQEMAAILGTSPEAAQKRVNRAVGRLRENLAKRGITAGTAGLAGVISANAVQVAPAGSAAGCTMAALGGTSATVITRVLTMTNLRKCLIPGTIAAITGTVIYLAAGSANPPGNEGASPTAPPAGKTKIARSGSGNSLIEERKRVRAEKPPAEREDIAKIPWPEVVMNFPPVAADPAEDDVRLAFDLYQIIRRQPAELSRLGGSGGRMIEIEVREVTSSWSSTVTLQSVGGRILADHDGKPQIENWGRGGGGHWSRQLYRYVAGEYKLVRIDKFLEWIEPGIENNPVTEPPFLPHGEGDDRGKVLHFVETRIPKP